jgi:hypothetical protein
MGIVYLARDASGREVALKVLSATSDRARSRFERERRLLATFTLADGFVPLLDAGETDRLPWFVMPFVDGGTLRSRLERGALPVREAISIATELARALARAHAKGVVHRDLKPENIIFTRESRPLVADLGIAKHFSDDAAGASQAVSLSRTGDLLGTAGYMAPEQTRDAKSAGPAADVFALGAILYECLAGWPAFEGATPLELLAAIDAARPKPVANVRPETPPWLAALVERALARSPASRYPDAGSLHAALEAAGRAPAGRGWKRAGAVSLGLVVASGLALAAHGLAPRPTPPRATERGEPAARVEAAVARLVERSRAAAPITSQEAPADLLVEPAARRAVEAIAPRLPVFSPEDARRIAAVHPGPAAATLCELASAARGEPGGRARFRAALGRGRFAPEVADLMDIYDRTAVSLAAMEASLSFADSPRTERDARSTFDDLARSRALAGLAPEVGEIVGEPLEAELVKLYAPGAVRLRWTTLQDLAQATRLETLPLRIQGLFLLFGRKPDDAEPPDRLAAIGEAAAPRLPDRPELAARLLANAIYHRFDERDRELLAGNGARADAALAHADLDLAALGAVAAAAAPPRADLTRFVHAEARRDIAEKRLRNGLARDRAREIEEGIAAGKVTVALAEAAGVDPAGQALGLCHLHLEREDAASTRAVLAASVPYRVSWILAECERLEKKPLEALAHTASAESTNPGDRANIVAVRILALLDAGRVAEARAALERLKTLPPVESLTRFRPASLEAEVARREQR